MTRSVHDISEIELSKSDTCTPELLQKFDKFLKTAGRDLYKIGQHPAMFAFDLDSVSDYFNDKGQLVKKRTPGNYQEHRYLCHASFNNVNEGTNGVINVFSKSVRSSSRPFLEFLIGDKSPWKKTFKDLVVIRDKKNDNHPVATVLLNTKDTPIQVYCNYQIASRLMTGWGLDVIWHRWVSLGFSPEVALAVLSMYQWQDMGLTFADHTNPRRWKEEPEKEAGWCLTRNGPVPNDQPFNQRSPLFSPRRLMDHNPNYNTEKFSLKDGARSNPCNCIWEDSLTKERRQGKTAFYKASIDGYSPFWASYMGLVTLSKKEIAKIEQDLYDEIPAEIFY